MHGDDWEDRLKPETRRQLDEWQRNRSSWKAKQRPSLWQRYNKHLCRNTCILILAALTLYYAVVRYEIVETIVEWQVKQ